MEADWNDTIQSASQHSSDTESRLALWNDYRHLLDQFRQTLEEVDQSVSENPVTLCDSDQVKQLLNLYQVSGLICS